MPITPTGSCKAIVVFDTQTGISRDRVVHDFAFNADVSLLGTAEAVAAAIIAFYQGGTDPLQGYLNRSLSNAPGGAHVKLYNISGAEGSGIAGSPVFAQDFQLTLSAIAPLPVQSALALSFHGDFSGAVEFGTPTPAHDTDRGDRGGHLRPRSRRRGRIYVGPLNTRASKEDFPGTLLGVPSDGFTSSLVNASKALLQAQNNGPFAWGIHSKKDAKVYPVIGGWVHNRFDVVRRRAVRATGRTLWP